MIYYGYWTKIKIRIGDKCYPNGYVCNCTEMHCSKESGKSSIGYFVYAGKNMLFVNEKNCVIYV